MFTWCGDGGSFTSSIFFISRLNLVPRLSRIRVPVMAMAAERDVLVSCSSLQDLCDHLRCVKFVKLPRGGHLSFVVDPVGQRLIGNPAHGGEHIIELY